MSYFDDPALLDRMLKQCVRCGFCQAHCPIYKRLFTESVAARGKIRLVKAVRDGEMAWSRTAVDRLYTCTLCLGCAAGCPTGVMTEEIFLGARVQAARQRGLGGLRWLVFRGLLHNPSLFRALLHAGARTWPLLFRSDPGPGGRPRLPLGISMRRVVPRLAPTPFLKSATVNEDRGARGARVLFFTGCLINYVYTGVGRAVLEVLERNGARVLLPGEQHCCGTPVFTNGDVITARQMAGYNLQVVEKYRPDAIVTACATCGSALKKHYPALCEGGPMEDAARRWAARTYDISEYLVKAGYRPPEGRISMSVTYHDPCHLLRGQGVYEAPRRLLAAIPGMEFREMALADRCCGGAGSFSLSHYALSLSITEQKLRSIRETRAAAVATGCGACRMQIEDASHQAGIGTRVMHTLELVAMSYRAEGREDQGYERGSGRGL
ncbi:MAG: (Fe-S)-binding protein [Bacillota bacterium]